MRGDPSCIFCRIITGEADASLVYQDDMVTVFMDIRPLTPGHLLVVPNHHVANLTELDDDTGGHVFGVGRKLALALRRSGLQCEGVNLFLADGAVAGQTVFHSHLHVIPRFIGDGFGFVHPAGHGAGVSREELERHAVMVKTALETR
jgi:histidine triad (HIT) family protein